VSVDDLDRFNDLHNLRATSFEVAAAFIKIIAEDLGCAQCIFDKFKGCSKAIARADNWLTAHADYKHIPDTVSAMPCPCPAHCTPALQAADIIAWEVRRYWDTTFKQNYFSDFEFKARKPMDRFSRRDRRPVTRRIEARELSAYFTGCDQALLRESFSVK